MRRPAKVTKIIATIIRSSNKNQKRICCCCPARHPFVFAAWTDTCVARQWDSEEFQAKRQQTHKSVWGRTLQKIHSSDRSGKDPENTDVEHPSNRRLNPTSLLLLVVRAVALGVLSFTICTFFSSLGSKHPDIVFNGGWSGATESSSDEGNWQQGGNCIWQPTTSGVAIQVLVELDNPVLVPTLDRREGMENDRSLRSNFFRWRWTAFSRKVSARCASKSSTE